MVDVGLHEKLQPEEGVVMVLHLMEVLAEQLAVMVV